MNFFHFVIILWVTNVQGHVHNLIKPGEGDLRFLNFERCLQRTAHGKLYGPHSNSTKYEKMNSHYNKMFEQSYPIAIFTPSSSKDVQVAVKCGVAIKTQLVPISGGHSYAGLSYGTNDSILIDFRLMNNISAINLKEKTVTVESGVFIGNLYFHLWKNGGFGAALGACTTVAMAGLALGGGIGYFSSIYGLVIDNLVEINMVDASGNFVSVDATHNADLWWAMRGVGSGYIGLVTSVKLKVFEAKELKLTYLKIRFHNEHFNNLMASYLKWLDWVKENDPTIDSVIIVRSENETSKCGSPDMRGTLLTILQVRDPKVQKEQNLTFVHAALDNFVDFHSFDLAQTNFIDFLDKFTYSPHSNEYCNLTSNAEKLEFFSRFTRDIKTPSYNWAKSFFVKKPYTAESFKEAERILLEIPDNGCGLFINSEQGAIGQHQSNESSYVHRDSLFNFKVSYQTEEEAEVETNKLWMNKLYDSVKFMDSGKSFQNYPERNLDDFLQRYYGSNLQRLIDVKNKWDPNHYFNSEMSIPRKYP